MHGGHILSYGLPSACSFFLFFYHFVAHSHANVHSIVYVLIILANAINKITWQLGAMNRFNDGDGTRTGKKRAKVAGACVIAV